MPGSPCSSARGQGGRMFCRPARESGSARADAEAGQVEQLQVGGSREALAGPSGLAVREAVRAIELDLDGPHEVLEQGHLRLARTGVLVHEVVHDLLEALV